MALTITQVSVGTSATKIADIPPGFEASIVNGATAFTLGAGSGVTTGNGCPVPANAALQPIAACSDMGVALYGIVGAGSATVGVILSRRA